MPEPSRKELSLLDATMLVMGGIVGVGIFFTPRAVAELVPHPSAFLGVWAIGGLVALCGAATFAELGGAFPRAGGWFVFLREAYGPFPAFLFACVVLGVISTGATAVMMEICTSNLAGLLPFVGPSRSPSALVTGAIVIGAVTALALAGAKVGAVFQNLCMLVKLAAILVLIAGGLFLAAPAAPQALAGPPSGDLARGMLAALLPVFFACGGWQMVCYVAPQVRDPARNVPRAIGVGVVLVVLLYLGLMGAYVRVLGIDGLAADTLFATRMAEQVLGAGGARLLQAAIAVSALGVCVVTIVTTPWLYVAMAEEGLFFRRFAKLHPRTQAPVLALCVQAALALAYWLWGQAELLVNAVIFVEWIFHGLVAIAAIRLRRTRPELPRPYKSPAFPLAPIVYALIAAAAVLGTLARASFRDAAIGLSVIALGAIVYRPWRRLVGGG